MKIENKKNLAIETEHLKIPALGTILVKKEEWEKMYLSDRSVRKAVEMGYIKVTNETK